MAVPTTCKGVTPSLKITLQIVATTGIKYVTLEAKIGDDI